MSEALRGGLDAAGEGCFIKEIKEDVSVVSSFSEEEHNLLFWGFWRWWSCLIWRICRFGKGIFLGSLLAALSFVVCKNQRKEVNAVLKKEAAYFGDIVILPFLDRYELVVLKTIAICEYGIQNVTAAYVMKCDDDTFIRLDIVLSQIEAISQEKSLYMGNLNLMHRPLRNGKWAVSYEEWPEAVYPPYANGPAYIISNDIARFISHQHSNGSLRLFKMEDVSMGLWVQQFNSSQRVQYSHNWKYCQYGCMQGYFTAHYQSPRQMLCLWNNLAKGRPLCCNFK